MKNIILLLFSCIVLQGTSQVMSTSEEALDHKMQSVMEKKTIEGAQVGDLICTDEFGNYIKCTGSQFEVIEGFTTSVPYVTPNKPQKKEDSRLAFTGRCSVENGNILVNDYLCPSKNVEGAVAKCSEGEEPYAVAMEDASENGMEFKVKVLGSKIK